MDGQVRAPGMRSAKPADLALLGVARAKPDGLIQTPPATTITAPMVAPIDFFPFDRRQPPAASAPAAAQAPSTVTVLISCPETPDICPVMQDSRPVPLWNYSYGWPIGSCSPALETRHAYCSRTRVNGASP